MNSQKFIIAYQRLRDLHPKQPEDIFKLRYLHVDWFFPQHLHYVLKLIKDFHDTYFPGADLEICLFAGLLHDAGLVYMRDNPSPEGHENRSAEFARNTLTELGFDNHFIDEVIEAIRSTEPSHSPNSDNGKLVRNADAYAHLTSMHFFAKANFSVDIRSFIKWFDSKLDTSFSKLTVPSLREEVSPLLHFYKNMIAIYNQMEQEKDAYTNQFVNEA